MHSLPATDPRRKLFPRTRHVNTSKKILGFMALPGELRNRIYDCYFHDDFRCEVAAKGHNFTQPKSTAGKSRSSRMPYSDQLFKHSSHTQDDEDEPHTLRMFRPLGRYNLVKGHQTYWPTSPFALTLVCKQVHAETVAYMYRKTTFAFAAPSRIMNFLFNVSKPNLQRITKLHIHYSTYGDPRLSRYCEWQTKHLKSWSRACSTVSKKLISLRELDIWVHVNECAPKFNLRQNWLQPMLEFRRLTRMKRRNQARVGSVQAVLEIVNVHFSTQLSTNSPFNNPELAKASDNLHALFGRAISYTLLGMKEHEAMAEFDDAWDGEYRTWQYHLGFAKIGW